MSRSSSENRTFWVMSADGQIMQGPTVVPAGEDPVEFMLGEDHGRELERFAGDSGSRFKIQDASGTVAVTVTDIDPAENSREDEAAE